MEILINRKAYPSEVAVKIEQLSTIAVSIANRWILGWPERVEALLKAGTYLEALQGQTELEKDVLTEAGNLNHLARHEILKMYEINEAPPLKPEGVFGSEWGQQVLRNMQRMTVDEEYRKSIAKDLS